jgi:uncharacterized membrane protein HdeD (DUF308 family)
MNQLLLGAITMASLTIGLFFLRFWKKTRDRFFLFFAIAFSLEGFNRALFGLSQSSNENEPIFYLVRLLSFLIILTAIIDKNRINKSQTDR